MSKHRQDHQSTQSVEEKPVKITMNNVMCGPKGNAFQGTVLDVPGDVSEESAKEMIRTKAARPYDAQKDRKARQHGLIKATATQ